MFLSSSLVQSVERRTVNPYVAGSSPVGGAKTLRHKISQELIFFVPKNPRHAFIEVPQRGNKIHI